MASQALAKGALWMQNVDYPAAWDRALIDALWPTEGVIDGFAVTANGGLGISVSAGRAIVSGDDTAANQGKYLIDQDSAVTLTLASVGSNRTEYVWLSVNDTAVAGGRAGNNVTIETSTTAVPASALLLATITLVAGTVTITSGMIADNRVYADVVPPASITTAKLVDSSVTTAKLADNSVTSAKIVNGTIATADIADGAVTLAKLEATLQATLDTIDPADAIIAIGGSTAPPGFALCDGSTYSRALYPNTFARLNAAGLPYGAGDGSTTFHVPNLQSRFIAGKGTAGWSNVVGETGGSKDAVAVAHTHTTADHSHTTADHSHNTDDHYHGVNIWSGGSNQDIVRRINNSAHSGFWTGTNSSPQDSYLDINSAGALALVWAGMAVDYTTTHQHYVSGNTGWATGGNTTYGANGGAGNTTNGATGGAGNTTNGQTPSASGTDANLPPYLTLNYCIRLR